MVLWKFTTREVKTRPGRATLTLASIVLSVAAVVSVTISTETTHFASREMFESVAGRAALEVLADGGAFYDESVLRTLEETRGVKAVVPVVQKASHLYYRDHDVDLLVMGIDRQRDGAVRDYALEQGEFFHEGGGALLETGFARALGIEVGDDVKLLTPRGMRTVTVVGLLSPRGAAGFQQGGIVFLPLPVAQALFAKPRNVNLTSLVLEDWADEKQVQAELAQSLPVGLHARSPIARTQAGADPLEDVEKALSFAYVLTLVVAVFMIFNTFLMNVGERRRQLSILRAIGTTRGQIVGMLLGEGLTMGILGTVLGALAGLGGAFLLTKAMGQIQSTAMPVLHVTPFPFLLAAALGPLISVVAMLIPAYLASLITPLEGMRPVISVSATRVSFSYAATSTIVFLVTGSILAACVVGWLPVGLTVYAGALFTGAFVFLVPLVLGLLARAVGAVLHPVLHVEGHLAERQILRRRARTTLTVGVLYIAVSTAVSMGTTIINSVQDVRNWYGRTMSGDFVVRPKSSGLLSSSAVLMPDPLAGEIRALDGVGNVDTIRVVNDVQAAGQAVRLVVRDFTDQDNLALDLKEGKPDEVRRRLAQGDVVIGTVLAQRTGTKVGDEIAVTLRGEHRLRVAGTITAYGFGGTVVYMQGAAARRLLDVEGSNMIVVNATPGAAAAVEAGLKDLCEKNGLMLHSFAELRQTIDNFINGVIASLWGLLALEFIVAAFGIANTLTINVLEQTRELALLRVVAMTRWQVRKTILSQAVIIGLIGLATGTIGGIIGSYVINLCSLPLLGHAADFVLHPTLLAGCFAIGLVVVLAAALLPAERAARLNLLIALQYE